MGKGELKNVKKTDDLVGQGKDNKDTSKFNEFVSEFKNTHGIIITAVPTLEIEKLN